MIDIHSYAGISGFYTSSPGTGGKIKSEVEDFKVFEEAEMLPEKPDGIYTLAWVTSRNWETNRLIKFISSALGISRKKITMAGTKDKRGITSQWLCIEAPLPDVEKISLKDVEISKLYSSDKRLGLGDLMGNRFEIVMRNMTAPENIHCCIEEVNEKGFPNFFGIQRFGTLRPVTHMVGRHIIKGDFKEAVMAYCGNPFGTEPPEEFSARSFLQETMDFSEAIKKLPKHLTFERDMCGYLSRNKDDYIGALKILPKNLLMMFVHAYQSYIFNRIVSERMKRGILQEVPLTGDTVIPVRAGELSGKENIPVSEFNINIIKKQIVSAKAFTGGLLPGTDSVFSKGIPGEIEMKIMEDENVSFKDFFVPSLGECSSKGMRRPLISRPSGLSCKQSEDIAWINFFLYKGTYATAFLREIIKDDGFARTD